MNRGQNRGIVGLKRACLAALCACLCLAALCGVASATSEAPKATVQPERSWESYFGVAILPSGRAVVVGDKGVVMVTDDQGKTWVRQQLRQGLKYFDLYSVAFTSDGTRGWIVGDGGVIFRSDDHGASWSEQKAATTVALLKVAVVDPMKACACGEHGVVLCTTDGGANWHLQKIQDVDFFDLAFADPDNGWAVGEFSTILHTADGGKSWQVQTGGDRAGKQDPYFAIAFGGRDGLIVGQSGVALESSDGGKTWTPGALSVEHRSFYALAALPAQADEFYAAGENGVAGLVTDARVSPLTSGTSKAITAAAFSSRFAMAVGLGGTLTRSEDGGQHWSLLNNREQALQTQAQ